MGEYPRVRINIESERAREQENDDDDSNAITNVSGITRIINTQTNKKI